MTPLSTSDVACQGTMALSGRERLLRALRGQPADRVPGWLMRQAGRYLPEYNEVRRRYDFLTLCKTPAAAAEVSIQPLKAIGTDAVIIFNDILIPLELAGARLEFDDQGPVIRNPIRSAEDLKLLAGREPTPEEPVAQAIREVRRRVGEEVPILGFIGAPWTLATYWVEGRVGKQFSSIGTMRFSDPGLLEDLLERITPIAARYLQIQIEAGADAVQIFDTWGSILGPDEYARFSASWIRQIIDAIKGGATGPALAVPQTEARLPADQEGKGGKAEDHAPLIVYVNGCAPYLDQLADLGADCLSIDWRLELRHARERLGPGLALQGNLDPLALLAGPEAIERAVRELFEKFPPAPGHVFNLGHGILPATPPASARALMEAVKRHGAY